MISNTYEKLERLLASGEWKNADQETARVMLLIADRESEGWLDIDSLHNFPSDDLQTIDQLWIKYSNGRFGFSVQKNIWLECGGEIDYDTECKIGNRIGWIVNGEWLLYDQGNFSLYAPHGHLPSLWIEIEREELDEDAGWLFLFSHDYL
jgi:serine/threonine-protein kinase